jgi:hypothetical protein
MSNSLIYYGPYLKPPIGLNHLFQFTDGVLPPQVQALIDQYPAFGSLFIDPSELSSTVRALRNSGTPQAQLFNYFKKILVK